VKKTLIIGTRASKLAMVQAGMVATYLRAAGFKMKLEPILTSGDGMKGDLKASGGKGLFVKEIEQALIDKRIDLAVHSMKDIPGIIARGLAIVAVIKREDPRDVMVSTAAKTLASLPAGSRVATSSPRRKVQISIARDDLDIIPIRGNIDTRLQKLKDKQAEAVIIAAAALVRLRIPKVITQYLPPDKFVPSPGQGALAIEVRREDKELSSIIQRACHDVPTAIVLTAERNFLRGVGGDCYTPLGAHAVVDGKKLELRGFLSTPDGSRHANETISGKAKDAADLGKRLADQLMAQVAGKSIGRRV
jgi:hydroxymethylbilane synthase